MLVQRTTTEKLMYKPIQQKQEDKGGAASLVAQVQTERTRMEEISRKIARGESVSHEELNYIKEKNPLLYDRAKDAKRYKQSLENQLGGAKSKEEAEEIVKLAKSNASLRFREDHHPTLFLDVIKQSEHLINRKQSEIAKKRIDERI